MSTVPVMVKNGKIYLVETTPSAWGEKLTYTYWCTRNGEGGAAFGSTRWTNGGEKPGSIGNQIFEAAEALNAETCPVEEPIVEATPAEEPVVEPEATPEPAVEEPVVETTPEPVIEPEPTPAPKKAKAKKVTTKAGHKTCSKCNNTKPVAAFYNSKGAPDGLRGECKECYKQGRKDRGR